MSDDLNRQIFKEEAYDLLSELEGTLLELEDSPHDMDLINRVFRALHTIKGSGSMFGFDDIADFTHEVETVFDMVRAEQLSVTTELLNLSFKARDYIQKLLDGTDGAAVDTEGMSAVLAGLQQLATQEQALESPEEPPQEDSSSLNEEVQEEESLEDKSIADSPEGAIPADESIRESTLYTLHVLVKDEKGADFQVLAPLFEELERIGEVEITGQPEQKAELGSGYEWDVQINTPCTEEEIKDVFLFTSVDLTVDVFPLESSPDLSDSSSKAVLEKETTQQPDAPLMESSPEENEVPRIGEILVEEGAVEEKDVENALKQQKPLGQILKETGKVNDEQLKQAATRQNRAKEEQAVQKRQETVSSIRVAAEKLDWLVDLVGELVIVQAQISQVVSERSDPVMTALSEELERLSDELRDSTLGIRMLPIGTTFSKFRRLVRDLSSDLDKEIVLNTNGAETELDKTVIERLSDPLVHLLRNSIDHGIEVPHVREAAGKPSAGMILLSAEHSGGEVLIRITDDGRGMDPVAIRNKAIERGLIAADAEIPDKKLFKLIFEPGFSTAQQVTNVSGRGVGMDVVKRAIDSLRGSIDIDSQLGKGTSITIRLPLTLAIIDGLQVQVGEECYVIPLSLVEECVELNRSELDKDESGQTLLHLRGEIVPYVHLRDFFMIEGNQPVIEQIVITGVEGSRVGIVVDTVIGEHQTVIKSLSRVYKDVEGISGATIKGDGSIALILDIPSLVRRIVVDAI